MQGVSKRILNILVNEIKRVVNVKFEDGLES